MLGLVAGLVGVFFANIIARVLLNRLTIVYHFAWTWTFTALIGTAFLTVITGWAASHRILGQKPLEVLRGRVSTGPRIPLWGTLKRYLFGRKGEEQVFCRSLSVLFRNTFMNYLRLVWHS